MTCLQRVSLLLCGMVGFCASAQEPVDSSVVGEVQSDIASAAKIAEGEVVGLEVAAITNLVTVVSTNFVTAVVTNNVMSPQELALYEEAARRRRIATRTFRLAFANAEEVAERINNTWTGDFGLSWKITKLAQAFPESNTVMVTAPGVILDACEEVVKTVDVETPQVYIEARFVELSNLASHKLGVDWSMLDGMKGTASLGGGMDRLTIGNAVQDFKRTKTTNGDTVNYTIPGKTKSTTETISEAMTKDGPTSSSSRTTTSNESGRDGGMMFFSGALSFDDMSLVLSALDGSSDARIFSNPKIIVGNGKKATVDMTTKYPNVAIAAKRTLNGNSESLDLDMKMAAIPGEDKLMFAKEAFFSWGISLEVTPRVSSNGLINVSIVPTISEVADYVTASSSSGATEGSKYPIIEVQRLVTDFSMTSGSTAVIGGLSKTTENQVDSGIPWLRDIPWIGDKLFGGKIRQKEQKEIIVFVTVGLATPRDLSPDVGLPKNAVLGRMYTEGVRLEPGDRRNPGEGFRSLDLRSLEEQSLDPQWTNEQRRVNFLLPSLLNSKTEEKK